MDGDRFMSADDGPTAGPLEPESTSIPSIERARLHIVLVEPEIAGNTGGIGRTCVAAGAALWLVRPLGFHVNDRNIRRAGLDYWPHLAFRIVDTIDEIITHFGPDRLWWFTTKATRSYTDATYREGDALVFGPESRGLPANLVADASRMDRALRIPIQPVARSLNLANAAAIAVYEARRQIGETSE
jgi:tRNA (cytidine/uridine-2'-O-)-methyltransferase